MQLTRKPGARLPLGSSKGLQPLGQIPKPYQGIVYARRQAERQQETTISTEQTEERPSTAKLPAELDKLVKLSKNDLQQELQVRGLEAEGKKDELASRLLESLVAEQSAISASASNSGAEQLQEATGSVQRGRRTSRKATTSADPIPAAEAVVTLETATSTHTVEAPTKSRRGRKTSRRVSSVLSEEEPNATAAADTMAGVLGQQLHQQSDDTPTASQGSKRARRSSRKSVVVDPTPTTVAQHSTTAVEGTQSSMPGKRGSRSSRKSTVADPAAGAVEAAAPAGLQQPTDVMDTPAATSSKRARRSSRKSAAMGPTAAETADNTRDSPAAANGSGHNTSRNSTGNDAKAAATSSAPPRTRSRSSTKSSSTGTEEAAPSRAKMLAQALAKKEISVHANKAAPADAAAATIAMAAAHAVESAAAEVPVTAAFDNAALWASDQLYAGSQAQCDSILMGTGSVAEVISVDSTSGVDVSYEEVIAQLTAEGVAGLSDEPQLASTSMDLVLPAFNPVAAAEPPGAAAASTGLLLSEPVEQEPVLADIVAAVADPLNVTDTAAAPLVEDELADDTLGAFDYLAVEPSAAANAGAALQQPSMADIAAAVLDEHEAPLEQDEAPDIALGAFDSLAVDPPAAANAGAAVHPPSLVDIAAAAEPAEASLGEDEEPDVVLSVFDHLPIDPPAAVDAAAALQEPNLLDIAAAEYSDEEAHLEEDESADEVLRAIDHVAMEPPAAANAGAALQEPSLLDIAAAAHADQEAPLEEDESADEVLTAFDHMAIEPPAAANAGVLQEPALPDIAAAAEPADALLGEDEEPDVALTAFDHMDFNPPAAAAVLGAAGTMNTVAASAVNTKQSYLHPVAVGHVPVVGTANPANPDTDLKAAPVPAVASSVVSQPAADNAGPAGLLQSWVSAVLKLFEQWQRSLSK